MASIRCAGSGMSKCFPCNCEMARSASSCIQARKFSRTNGLAAAQAKLPD
jgi:hypothetical protein